MNINTPFKLEKFLFNGFLVSSKMDLSELVADVELNYPPEDIRPLKFTLSATGSIESLSILDKGLKGVSFNEATDCMMLIKLLDMPLRFKHAFMHAAHTFTASPDDEATAVYTFTATPHRDDKIKLCDVISHLEY